MGGVEFLWDELLEDWKIQNPKSEINPKSKIRMPKAIPWDFKHSNFVFVSNFVFRIFF